MTWRPAGQIALAATCAILAAICLFAWRSCDAPPAGPDLRLLLGTWEPDAARNARIPAALRVAERRLKGLRLEIAPGRLEFALDGTVHRGTTRITSMPPVFYRIQVDPDDGGQSLVVECDRAEDGLDLRLDDRVVPLRQTSH